MAENQIKIEESLIIKALVTDQEYFLKCMPRLEGNLFTDESARKVFGVIQKYYERYNKQPTVSVLDVAADRAKDLTDDTHKKILNLIRYVSMPEELNMAWVSDASLEWIRRRKYWIALMSAAEQYDKDKLDPTLSEKLDSALATSFDNTVGMEFSDAEARWDKYTSQEEHIPFDLDILNTITNGGVCRGTLNVFMSSDTGGFKSGTMCHIAAGMIRDGRNVLYISCEMAEDKIMERIDANLLDIEIDNLKKLGKETFINRIQSISTKSHGRCIVKQFPTSMAHVGHIRYLLRELRMKRGFVPDVMFVDYINIMASSRVRNSELGNSYGFIKAITEEVRGLSIEYNIPIFSATQSNRGGSGNEDLNLTDISDSYGMAYSVDLMVGIITTPDFDEQHKICFRQLKNRYRDKNENNKFFLGVNKAKMKLYEIAPVQWNASPAQVQAAIDEDNAQAEMFKARRRKINL